MRRMAESPIVTRIAYDGEALQDGSMDVRDLAPALLALGELLQGANHVLNGDRATLAVKVQSDFKTGSFDVGLVLFQGVATQVLSIFGSDTIKTAKEIAAYIGLITGVDVNLLSLLKWLKGKEPKATKVGNGSVEISVTGDNNQVEVKIVRGEVYEIANDHMCRQAAENVVKPLRSQGIDVFEVRKGRHVIEKVTKEDLPSFELPEAPAKILDEVPPITEVVEIVKPSFDEDLTWTLSDGNGRFDAVMKDPNFIDRVKAGEDFRIGDLLRVTIDTHQSLTANGLRTRREVVRVVEEIKAPRQANLLPIPQFERSTAVPKKRFKTIGSPRKKRKK